MIWIAIGSALVLFVKIVMVIAGIYGKITATAAMYKTLKRASAFVKKKTTGAGPKDGGAGTTEK